MESVSEAPHSPAFVSAGAIILLALTLRRFCRVFGIALRQIVTLFEAYRRGTSGTRSSVFTVRNRRSATRSLIPYRNCD
jgi:hypothetical protein